MTNQEAIESLQIESNKWERDCKSYHPTKEALKVAISTLEENEKLKEKLNDTRNNYSMAVAEAIRLKEELELERTNSKRLDEEYLRLLSKSARVNSTHEVRTNELVIKIDYSEAAKGNDRLLECVVMQLKEVIDREWALAERKE